MVALDQVMSLFGSVKLYLVGLALLGIIVNCVLMTYRWACILWIRKPTIPFGHLIRLYLLSSFLGNVLPSSVSSDILTMYCASKYTADSKAGISSVVIDRVIGALSLGVIVLAALILLRATGSIQFDAVMFYAVLSGVVLAVAIPLSMQQSTVIRWVRRRLSLWRGVIAKGMGELYEEFLLYQGERRVMARVLVMSFASHFISIVVYYTIAESFFAAVPIAYFFLFIPVAGALTMLPISVGGLGVVEAALVFLFSQVGMPIERCVAMALVHRTLLVVASLPGGAIYIAHGLPMERVPAEGRWRR
jgi:hypothetical protein